MNVADLTNSELEEMGEPLPCDCRTLVRQHHRDLTWEVCEDCHASYPVSPLDRYFA